MSKNIIYDDRGLPLWKTKEYISKIGKLLVNFNRGGYRYVVWYDFDEEGYPNRKTFSKKKEIKEYLSKIKAEYVAEYYSD